MVQTNKLQGQYVWTQQVENTELWGLVIDEVVIVPTFIVPQYAILGYLVLGFYIEASCKKKLGFKISQLLETHHLVTFLDPVQTPPKIDLKQIQPNLSIDTT